LFLSCLLLLPSSNPTSDVSCIRICRCLYVYTRTFTCDDVREYVCIYLFMYFFHV
jgi:hypothetical protein